ARLGVMDRPGAAYDLHSLEALIPGLSAALLPFDAPLIDISGSDIRARVAAGRSIRYMLPPHVAMYIYQHALYQDSARSASARTTFNHPDCPAARTADAAGGRM